MFGFKRSRPLYSSLKGGPGRITMDWQPSCLIFHVSSVMTYWPVHVHAWIRFWILHQIRLHDYWCYSALMVCLYSYISTGCHEPRDQHTQQTHPGGCYWPTLLHLASCAWLHRLP
jgi:hypothetical protein